MAVHSTTGRSACCCQHVSTHKVHTRHWRHYGCSITLCDEWHSCADQFGPDADVDTSLSGLPPSSTSALKPCTACAEVALCCCVQTSSHAHGSTIARGCGASGRVSIGIAHVCVSIQPGRVLRAAVGKVIQTCRGVISFMVAGVSEQQLCLHARIRRSHSQHQSKDLDFQVLHFRWNTPAWILPYG
jgi:hypothetical protein